MKNLLPTLALSGLFASAGANAISVTPINGVQGEQMCKQHIATLVHDSGVHESGTHESGAHESDGIDSKIEFQRESASSLRGSNFKYWINANERQGDQNAAVRYRCEVSRNGELIEIIEEPGRWNI